MTKRKHESDSEKPTRKRGKGITGKELDRFFDEARASKDVHSSVPCNLDEFENKIIMIRTRGKKGPKRTRHKRDVAWKSPRGYRPLADGQTWASYCERKDLKYFLRRYYRLYGKGDDATRIDIIRVLSRA